MAVLISPIPNQPVSDTHEWRDWFFNIGQNINTGGIVRWDNIVFDGSNITSIVNRQHNSLQGLQGGGNSGTEYYHLNATQYAGTTNYTNPVSTITVTASPFTYQNTSGYAQSVIITGGVASLIDFSRDNSTFYTVGTVTNTMTLLSPNDYIRITYTVAPTMVSVPR
jgi:hypothetical protein